MGLSEKAAREQYGREGILVGRYFFQSNGRALASGRGEGFVKVVVEKRYQELLGVHILGGDAAEMIAEAAALLHAEVPADEIADMIHAHPTYSEAFMEPAPPRWADASICRRGSHNFSAVSPGRLLRPGPRGARRVSRLSGTPLSAQRAFQACENGMSSVFSRRFFGETPPQSALRALP